MKSIPIISVSYLLLIGFRLSWAQETQLIRKFDTDIGFVKDSINVNVVFINETPHTIRGFYYVDHVSPELDICISKVRIGDKEISDYYTEVGENDEVYPGTIPFRLILESPMDFIENNPIEPYDSLRIDYSIISSIADTFNLYEYHWVGYSEADRSLFGTSLQNDKKSIAFIEPNLTIVTSKLKDARIDSFYTDTLRAIGGTIPYSWFILTGALPNGLELSMTTGEISGIPVKEGLLQFDIKVTDGSNIQQADTQSVSLNVLKFTSVDAHTKFSPFIELKQNFPNPFNPQTTIPFSVLKKTQVKLYIYNETGQLICPLLDATLSPGSYQVNWDGRGGNGQILPSGIYIYSLYVGRSVFRRKLVLLH